MKNQKGITLIALIVTIIVLLITAGVTVSFVVGDDGIIENAGKAAEETKEAQDKEAIEMADTALKIDAYSKENKPDSSIDWTKYYTEEIFNKYLGGNGSASNFVNNSDGTIQFEYKDDKTGEITRYEVDSNGKLIENILANKITTDNYGDKVEYTANTISDWRIFYVEGKNVFLISTDYLPNNLIDLEKTHMAKLNGKYKANWPKASDTTFQTADQLSLFKATGYTLNSKYGNSRFVSTLLNTKNWTSFVDDTKASYAIGTPTLEMWIASWNEKYSDSLRFGSDVKGYKIGINTLSDKISASTMNAKEGYKVEEANNMYYPHKNAVDGCYGYWLAAPSYDSDTNRNSNNAMMNVECDGLVGFTTYADYCLRPIVCLKNTTTGKKIGDVWVLE